MIKFVNLPWLNPEDNFFSKNLPLGSLDHSKVLIYNIRKSKNIDFSKYNGYKIICYSAENIKNCGYTSPYEILDKGHYLMSMERVEHPNYLRLPNIVRADFYDYNYDLVEDFTIPTKTKFCSFIYRHDVKYRNNFVKQLSKFKRVDCLGPCLNNVKLKSDPSNTKHVGNVEEIAPYKFNIAFENSSTPGYCTEKIWWGFLAKTISIYWGDPTVTQDFHQGSFLNRHEYDSDREFIDAIIELDNNDDAYREMLTKPKLKDKSLVDLHRVKIFLEKVINT